MRDPLNLRRLVQKFRNWPREERVIVRGGRVPTGAPPPPPKTQSRPPSMPFDPCVDQMKPEDPDQLGMIRQLGEAMGADPPYVWGTLLAEVRRDRRNGQEGA